MYDLAWITDRHGSTVAILTAHVAYDDAMHPTIHLREPPRIPPGGALHCAGRYWTAPDDWSRTP